jgi:AcrR family transcriptional regulator
MRSESLSGSAESPRLGLRERKRAKTRALIQSEALRLFREQGYERTTVEQIIDAAEVSESTFFRYFPTKKEVVLWDDYDPLIVEAFEQAPAELSSIQALGLAFREVMASLPAEEQTKQRERTLLCLQVPELRAAMLDQFASAMQLLAAAVAEREGRRPDDFAVRTLAGAVVGAAMAVLLALADDPAADVWALLEEAIAHLEAGLRL